MSESTEKKIPTLFITGAGRRLGLYLAEYYLTQGCRVIVHFNSQNELSSELQTQYRDENRYLALQADLTSASQVESLIHQVEEYLVQNNIELDTLIHNASCFWSDDTELSLIQRWQQTERLQAVHVLAPQAITSGLAHRFAKQGSIIALTDIYAELPNSRFASYCSAKAGLQNLALSWAQQLAPNIRVNTIQPGPIKFLPEHDESYQQMVLSQSLLGRELGYGAIQQGIDYLISATALTGSTIKIDGGRSSANRYQQ